MMSLLIAAFVMGGIGTLHCVGMCGPLALSLPVVNTNNTSRFFSTLLYNMGRVITYSVLGAIIGIAGTTFAFFGYQQWLSVIIGVLILLFLLFPKNKFSKRNALSILLEKIRSKLGNLFFQKNYKSVFFIGLLNGLLPCGLVYMAIAGAVSTASVLKSSLFMAAFGLGTLPMMWSVAFFGGFINLKMRTGIKKLYPYIMFSMALLLIIRGLGLGIPYLSPALNNHGAVIQQTIECHD